MTSSGLKQIFLTSRPVLTRFLRAHGAGDDAEDLVQELFIKLDDVGQGPIAQPRSYLFRMANNLLLDRRRSASCRARREQEWSQGGTGMLSEVDGRPSAEEALIARERLETVTNAIAQLPERTAAIFRKFRLDGESQKMIADDLSISLSAVEKHLQRAYRVVIDVKRQLDAGMIDELRLPKEGDVSRD